jgi:hypothetical protein
LSSDHVQKKIQQFVEAYFESRNGKITQQPNDAFTVTLPNEAAQEYTYQPAVSREKKIPLLSTGSPAFQELLRDCLENGVLCQILLKPKDSYEALLRSFFKDAPFNCQDCTQITVGKETATVCMKPQPCYHTINNGKIIALKAAKTEPIRYFQFYFSVTFHNRLRSKNEETIAILIDEKGNDLGVNDFSLDDLSHSEAVEILDYKSKLKADTFKKLKTLADEKLAALLKGKVALFELPLGKEKQAKLRSFEKRLRKERREQVISRKHDFDFQKWQSSFEALLKKEEESYITNIAVKFINLLVINTARVRCEISLDNHASIEAAFVLGIQQDLEVTCPICKKSFSEGYATRDGLYVCDNCTRQSIDTGKIYSKKAHLLLDEKLKEYFEPEAGFVCSVCGKKHSRLLEFKCSHDGSSVCVNHYDLCDDCGKIFSKANLTHTEEFKHQLCPKHALKVKGAKK